MQGQIVIIKFLEMGFAHKYATHTSIFFLAFPFTYASCLYKFNLCVGCITLPICLICFDVSLSIEESHLIIWPCDCCFKFVGNTVTMYICKSQIESTKDFLSYVLSN